MQTFLPFVDFHQTAQCLDPVRLGKQRVECLQILNAIRTKTGWSNHPVTKMWRGYEDCLCLYASIMCLEWIDKGFKDNLLIHFGHKRFAPTPKWLGRKDFHDSHQSNLLRKNKLWYGKQFNVRDDLPYIWPEGG